MKAATPRDTDTLLRLATYASTATAMVLIGVKGMAWFMTGSLSVMASLVDSLMDAAASLINLLAVRYSLKCADEDHQFGHGKAESLAGLGQACFIGGSAIFLLMHAAERLNRPQPLQDISIGLWVMVFAMAATLALLVFQAYVIKLTNSSAIRADALHYKTDLLTNAATIAALYLAAAGHPLLDPLGAMAIACYILYSAWQIGKEAMQVLMDRELPKETRQRICDIVLAHGTVLGLHDLRTRQSGQIMLIQLHLDLDQGLRLAEAHRVAKEVEHAIMASFPRADVIIHQDPRNPAHYRRNPQECNDLPTPPPG
ncbi:MAG: cation diffusion facilitator family transporter [Proteobacteria bacterium]|nr:cation diffusion facilitator family transporter [Pseudomonadota bacterium]MBU1546445.1 cation diffusion facilitator family transporter [Pseudomonadota bacterium]MBU2619349.1 cation diffusion facilitator family transporter [Pseudomonadota bacterium]